MSYNAVDLLYTNNRELPVQLNQSSEILRWSMTLIHKGTRKCSKHQFRLSCFTEIWIDSPSLVRVIVYRAANCLQSEGQGQGELLLTGETNDKMTLVWTTMTWIQSNTHPPKRERVCVNWTAAHVNLVHHRQTRGYEHRRPTVLESYQISKQNRRTDDPPVSHINIPLPAPTHTHTCACFRCFFRSASLYRLMWWKSISLTPYFHTDISPWSTATQIWVEHLKITQHLHNNMKLINLFDEYTLLASLPIIHICRFFANNHNFIYCILRRQKSIKTFSSSDTTSMKWPTVTWQFCMWIITVFTYSMYSKANVNLHVR